MNIVKGSSKILSNTEVPLTKALGNKRKSKIATMKFTKINSGANF